MQAIKRKIRLLCSRWEVEQPDFIVTIFYFIARITFV